MIAVYYEVANWYRTKRHFTTQEPPVTGNELTQAICSRYTHGLSHEQFEKRRSRFGSNAVSITKPWGQLPFCLTCLRMASKNTDLDPQVRKTVANLIANKGVPFS